MRINTTAESLAPGALSSAGACNSSRSMRINATRRPSPNQEKRRGRAAHPAAPHARAVSEPRVKRYFFFFAGAFLAGFFAAFGTGFFAAAFFAAFGAGFFAAAFFAAGFLSAACAAASRASGTRNGEQDT